MLPVGAMGGCYCLLQTVTRFRSAPCIFTFWDSGWRGTYLSLHILMAEEASARELWEPLLGASTLPLLCIFQLPKKILVKGQHQWGREVYPPMNGWREETEYLQDSNGAHLQGYAWDHGYVYKVIWLNQGEVNWTQEATVR